VKVKLERGGVVRIVNGGPTLSLGELQELKKRFRRGKTSAGGSCVGLAIAQRIITQMGGKLELFSPACEAGDGFEARLTLPPAFTA
jgi:two-component system OmpR family sensor kinase